MKVHFRFKILPATIIFTLLSACYSVEFYPTADYPNLRRADVDEVEIRTSAPRDPYEKLGQLVVKDPAADLENRNFRRFLKNEARDRGAEGVWIVRRSRYNNQVITGSPTDRNYTIETGQVDVETGVLTVILYNYKRDTDSSAPNTSPGEESTR